MVLLHVGLPRGVRGKLEHTPLAFEDFRLVVLFKMSQVLHGRGRVVALGAPAHAKDLEAARALHLV